MNKVQLMVNTDRDEAFVTLSRFVDAVRRISNVTDEQVQMTFSHEDSDHEVAVHVVDPEGAWNQQVIEVDNETVVVFRKEALAPEDGKTAWRLAYADREIPLTQRGRNPSRVLEDGQVMIKGVGNFPKTHFRAVRRID